MTQIYFHARMPHLTTMLLIAVVPAVVFMVTFEGQGDAGARGHAAELVGWVTGGSGYKWTRHPFILKRRYFLYFQKRWRG